MVFKTFLNLTLVSLDYVSRKPNVVSKFTIFLLWALDRFQHNYWLYTAWSSSIQFEDEFLKSGQIQTRSYKTDVTTKTPTGSAMISVYSSMLDSSDTELHSSKSTLISYKSWSQIFSESLWISSNLGLKHILLESLT